MLKHGRAGVPMEVMGLMLGEFIDDTTVSRKTGRHKCFADVLLRYRQVEVYRKVSPTWLTFRSVRRCIRHAAIRNVRHGRIRRSRFPDKDAGHAQADGTVGLPALRVSIAD